MRSRILTFFFFKKSLTLLIYNGIGLVFSGGQKLLLFVYKFLISTATRYSGFSPFYSHALCMWLWPNRKHWDLYFIFRRSLPQLAFVLVAFDFLLLYRPGETQTGLYSCLGFQLGLYHVFVALRVLRSTGFARLLFYLSREGSF